MAVTNAFNQYRITADNDTITFAATACIQSILYIPGTTSPEATIKETDTSGKHLWKTGANATSRIFDSEVELKVAGGATLHFDLAGTGTEVILYYE